MNPRDHDIGAIVQSIRRFGFVAPAILNEATGRVLAGHGRIEALDILRRQGDDLPAGLRQDDKGRWLVPVVAGIAFADDSDALAYIVADNRLTELGGWNDAALIDVLTTLHEAKALKATGYDGDDLDSLIAASAGIDHAPGSKSSAPGVQEDDIAAAQEAEQAQSGDLWRFGSAGMGWQYLLIEDWNDLGRSCPWSISSESADDLLGKARAEGLETVRLCTATDWLTE